MYKKQTERILRNYKNYYRTKGLICNLLKLGFLDTFSGRLKNFIKTI